MTSSGRRVNSTSAIPWASARRSPIKPTHAISASAGVGYTKTQRRGDSGTSTIDNVSPVGRLSLINDIFLADLSGSSNWRSSGEDRGDSTYNNWEGTLATNWRMPLWPSIRFSYSEYTENPESSNLFGTDGNQETTTSIDVTWDLLLANVSYSFSHNTSEPLEEETTSETDTHFVRLDTGGQFWGDRISFDLAQQYARSENEVSFSGSGESEFPLPWQGFFSVDPVVLPEPVVGDTVNVNLSPIPGVVLLPQDERVSFVVNADEPELTDLLRVFVGLETDDGLAGALQWDLYRQIGGSISGGVSTWILVQEDIPTTYNLEDRSIDIPIGSSSQQFMVTSHNPTNLDVLFTRIQAYSFVTQDVTSTNTSYLTNFSAGYRITPALRLSGTVNYQHNEFETDDVTSEIDRWNGSARLQWTLSSILSTSAGYSMSLEQPDRSFETEQRSYSWVVSSTPIPKLNLSAGVTFSENYSDKEKFITSDRYYLTAKAPIYPDLTARGTLSYSESERLDEDGDWRKDETISGGLDLNARLAKYLFADFLSNYAKRKDADGETTQVYDLSLGLSYRPSPLLSVRGDYKSYFGDFERDDEFRLNAVLRLLDTYKTQLTINGSHNQRGSESTQNVGLVGTWTISRNLFLQGRGNYRFADLNTYNFSFDLNYRL